MANEKISAFSTISTIPGGPIQIKEVEGIAAYCDDPNNPGTKVNVSFSGSDIEDLYLQDLNSVLNQGNESPNGGEIKMLDAGGFNPLTFSQTGLAASPSSNIAFTGSGFITMVASGNAGGISLSTGFNTGSANVIVTAGATGGRLELRSEGLLRFNFESPTANQVLQTINTSGDMEWVDLPSGAASGLGDVLTTDNESDDGQILAMIDGAERLEVSKDIIRHTGVSGDFDIINANGTLRLSANGGLGLILNSSNTIKVLDDVEFDVNGIIDRLGNLGTGGQALLSTGSALEWTTYGLEQVLQTSSAAGTGQSITFTDGTNINVLSVTGFDSASTATLEVKSSGANVEVNSVNNDVILKGGGDLVLENTGLGTPVSGDYLVADGVTGKAKWQTDPKAFVTLTGSPTWVIRNGYNATWNIAAGSETLSITADDGDSGTLIVINNGGEITWPANSNWPDATEPTLTATGTDVFSFIYDGTNYYWSFGQNFGA